MANRNNIKIGDFVCDSSDRYYGKVTYIYEGDVAVVFCDNIGDSGDYIRLNANELFRVSKDTSIGRVSDTEIGRVLKDLRKHGLSNGSSLGYHSGLFDTAADLIEKLAADNAELRKKLSRE